MEIGPSAALRFLTLLHREPNDYVEISKRLYEGQSVDEIFERAKKHWKRELYASRRATQIYHDENTDCTDLTDFHGYEIRAHPCHDITIINNQLLRTRYELTQPEFVSVRISSLFFSFFSGSSMRSIRSAAHLSLFKY